MLTDEAKCKHFCDTLESHTIRLRFCLPRDIRSCWIIEEHHIRKTWHRSHSPDLSWVSFVVRRTGQGGPGCWIRMDHWYSTAASAHSVPCELIPCQIWGLQTALSSNHNQYQKHASSPLSRSNTTNWIDISQIVVCQSSTVCWSVFCQNVVLQLPDWLISS